MTEQPEQAKWTFNKWESSVPENGHGYYEEGEIISYGFQVFNNASMDDEMPIMLNVQIIDEMLNPTGNGSIYSFGGILPGNADGCGYDYTVTAEDVARGYISNTAKIVWNESDKGATVVGQEHTLYSNTVIVYTAPQQEQTEGEGKLYLEFVTSTEPKGAGDTVQTTWRLSNPGDLAVKVRSHAFDNVTSNTDEHDLSFVGGSIWDAWLKSYTGYADITVDFPVTAMDVQTGYIEITLQFSGLEANPGLAVINGTQYNPEKPVTSNRVTVTLPLMNRDDNQPALMLVSFSDPAVNTTVELGQDLSSKHTVINTGNEPIRLAYLAQADSGVQLAQYVDVVLMPGESDRTAGILTPVTEFRVTQNAQGQKGIRRSYQAVGFTESGRMVMSNTTEMWNPIKAGTVTVIPFDPTHDPKAPYDPRNREALLQVVKEVTSTPANGSYYTAGEEINYTITYKNVSDKKCGEVVVYDVLQPGSGEIGSAEHLHPGEERVCYFTYRVKPLDVSMVGYGYIFNTAFAVYDDDGIERVATSNIVSVPIRPNPPIMIVPGLVPTTTPNEAGIDYCELQIVGQDGICTTYTQHYCTDHDETRLAVKMMTGAASTPALKLAAWQYSRSLWETKSAELFEQLM